MARKPRYLFWSEEACYHIFNRGHNREVVFRRNDDRRYFLELWQRYRDRFSLRIYHYCLMDNHFHVQIQLEDARQFPPSWRGWLSANVRQTSRVFSS